MALDFYQIRERIPKAGTIEVFPDFIVKRSKDLMVRGKCFYAVWDEEKGMWSTDEYDVARLVDAELIAYRDALAINNENIIRVKLLSDFSNKTWTDFKNYLSRVSDNSTQLDTSLAFLNTKIKKKDYISKKLPYSLEEGKYDAFEEIMSTLYDPEERAKLEWAIGSIVAGDSKDIQKFFVLYGAPGTGKSTFFNIVQKLFEGYYVAFDAKALTSASNAFATEVFRTNPLVAIQHDGDLSKIEDNTKLNSISSHEEMTMNEKYKSTYTARSNALLFMGTNLPVKISDSKAGVIRRLMDVSPSGRTIPTKKYHALIAQIDFELGAIAHHCLEVYREMGKSYYSTYRPLNMMFRTDVFFNFVEENYSVFKEQDGATLAQAFEMYKTFCQDSNIDNKMPKYKFRDELKNYFNEFSANVKRIDGKLVRSYYSGFISSKFTSQKEEKEEPSNWVVLDQTKSIFDEVCADCFAQYATEKETPYKKWSEVTTKLSDIDTTKLHYVVVPLNHIVIDFDLKNDKGEKSAELNFEAASKWPPTYAEYSKSQSGLHLHYFYDGDTDRLSSIFEEGIEVKVFRVGNVGPSSLRRKLSKCNNIPISTINSGLPLKGEKVINIEVVKSEKALRELILRNLRKEIHPGTKPSIDFIHKILEESYSSGLKYDVSDLRGKVMVFANNSTNQAPYCLDLVSKMHFASDEPSVDTAIYDSDTIVFFDIEVFPNLVMVNWKPAGEEHACVHMINPTPSEIEGIFKFRLVGFNNRNYDNHILYAIYMGYKVEDIYALSQRIIVDEARNAKFGEAYNISYADVYDFSSVKQSLKKWQIQLGIHHQELGLPWDKPVPEDKWPDVANYCDNDVISLEATFDFCHEDFIARQILAELSGLTVNDTTQQHTARILFGNDSAPQKKFIYTDLSVMFPGYKYSLGKSTYRDEDPGEGGYVYSEPGIYSNVALLDVASMHPTSIELLNLFGPYTKTYSEIKAARIAIKHKDYDSACGMLGGILDKYLSDPKTSDALSYALKIVLNIVYGLTSAKFDNKFRDPRNVDNIVAKRGALFMIDLKYAVQELGFTVAHIKTDSIKIPNATPEIINFVFDFGKKYGYNFEHEATYDRFCLVNDAVYVARYKDGKHAGEWTATGTQFQQPYVFKTIFSKEPIEFKDLCETKTVSSALYLDMNEGLGKDDHDYHFVGKAGLFCPIRPGFGGGILYREKDGKYYAVTGTKGYRWLESEVVKSLEKEEAIDLEYYRKLVDDAIEDIRQYGDFEWFMSNEPALEPMIPWD
jgi:hypothetical protein